MPRVIIKPHDFYPVRSTVDVRVADLNYGAHLGYDRVLTLVHDARLKLFAHLDVSELDLGDGQTGIVAADAAVSYRGEAFLHDALLFETRPVEVGAASFRLAHRISKVDGGQLVALVEVGFAAFDYQKRRASRLPEQFAGALKELEQMDAGSKELAI